MKVLIASCVVIAFSFAGLSTASADSGETPEAESALGASERVTDDEYKALFDTLMSADIPSTETEVGHVRAVSFEVEGFTLTLSDPEAAIIEPMVGGGFDLGKKQFFLTFNQTDQTALIAGGGTALGAAICAIPAAGQLACSAAATIIAIAGVHVNEHGRCSNGKTLKVWLRGINPSKMACI